MSARGLETLASLIEEPRARTNPVRKPATGARRTACDLLPRRAPTGSYVEHRVEGIGLARGHFRRTVLVAVAQNVVGLWPQDRGGAIRLAGCRARPVQGAAIQPSTIFLAIASDVLLRCAEAALSGRPKGAEGPILQAAIRLAKVWPTSDAELIVDRPVECSRVTGAAIAGAPAACIGSAIPCSSGARSTRAPAGASPS